MTSTIYVSHREIGLWIPRPEWLTALTRFYGVEVGNLFGVKVDKQKGRPR